MLDFHRVIQLFDHVDRLPRGGGVEDSIGDRHRSFASVWNDPQTIPRDCWDNHGHTGYAWAARRELFEQVGLYEAAILGNGDDLMAHRFLGELHSDCIMRNYDQGQAMFRHYQKWAHQAFRYCQGDLGCMPGTVFHLWHGDHENRLYMERHNDMRKIGFDSFVDITIDEAGCLRWASDHPELHHLSEIILRFARKMADRFLARAWPSPRQTTIRHCQQEDSSVRRAASIQDFGVHLRLLRAVIQDSQVRRFPGSAAS